MRWAALLTFVMLIDSKIHGVCLYRLLGYSPGSVWTGKLTMLRSSWSLVSSWGPQPRPGKLDACRRKFCSLSQIAGTHIYVCGTHLSPLKNTQTKTTIREKIPVIERSGFSCLKLQHSYCLRSLFSSEYAKSSEQVTMVTEHALWLSTQRLTQFNLLSVETPKSAQKGWWFASWDHQYG